MIRVPHHRFNHKGGQLQFGPDGTLYAGFGDGGGGGDPDRNGQNLSRQLGKMIRIAPRPGGGYSCPRDNPFRGRAGAPPEIYAYGLRNPYRFSFDRRTGGLDDRRRGPGRGRGDRLRAEPPRPRPAPRGGLQLRLERLRGPQPLSGGQRAGRSPAGRSTHPHDDGYCSITGGYVIRDRSLGRGLYGKYVYGDYCKPNLRWPRCGRAAAVAPARGPGAEPRLVRRGRPRARYAVSLDGPVTGSRAANP